MSEAENMAIKISKRIVDYKIQKDDEPTAASAAPQVPEKETMHEDIERPEELRGYTYKIKTPLTDHALYITINNIVLNRGTEDEQEYPFEIFINSKNMEHFQWVLALTRVLSAVFRKGGDATFLVDEMKQVFDPQGGYFKKGGRFMPSLVAEIGEVLETHMKKIGLIEDEELSAAHQAMLAEKRAEFENKDIIDGKDEASYPESAQLCDKCNTKAVIMMDGCMTCLACGASKCG